MLFRVIFSGLFGLVLIVGVRTLAIKSYYMEDHCGGLLDFGQMGISAAEVQYRVPSLFTGRQNCVLFVGGRSFPGSRLSLTVYEVNLNKNCSSSFLEIYRMQPLYGNVVQQNSPKVTICDRNQIGTVMSTDRENEFFVLNFTGDSSIPPYLTTGFLLKVSSYTEGIRCASSERMCYNGRCVSNDIWCKHFNPCGDNSDKCEDQTRKSDFHYGSVIGLVLASVLIAILIISITLYLRKRHIQRSSRTVQQQTTQSLFARLREAYAQNIEENGGIDNPAMVAPPPAYDELDHSSPPAYDSVMSNQEIYKISGNIGSVESINKPTESV